MISGGNIRDIFGNLLNRIFVLQKVNTKYPWGNGFDYLLMSNASPSDLDGDDTLDYEEKTGIADTEETLQIDKTFVFADLLRYDIQRAKGGYMRAVAKGGVARTGSTDGNVYLTKIVFQLGYVNEDGNFTSKSEATANTNFNTNSTDYEYCSGQAWLEWDFDVPAGYWPALRVMLYGKVATTESGKMKLCLSRGAYDSYLEF